MTAGVAVLFSYFPFLGFHLFQIGSYKKALPPEGKQGRKSLNLGGFYVILLAFCFSKPFALTRVFVLSRASTDCVAG